MSVVRLGSSSKDGQGGTPIATDVALACHDLRLNATGVVFGDE
jgi:hypothetical protein